MAITYSWTINPLECYPTSSQGPDYVFTAHWQLHATETISGSTYTATSVGVQPIPMSTGSFTPFEDLTLEQVSGWVETEMGEERLTSLKESLANNINNQINPPVVTLPSPWLPTGSVSL